METTWRVVYGTFVPMPTFEVEVTRNTLTSENVQVLVLLPPVPQPAPVQESIFKLVNLPLVVVMLVPLALVKESNVATFKLVLVTLVLVTLVKLVLVVKSIFPFTNCISGVPVTAVADK